MIQIGANNCAIRNRSSVDDGSPGLYETERTLSALVYYFVCVADFSRYKLHARDRLLAFLILNGKDWRHLAATHSAQLGESRSGAIVEW